MENAQANDQAVSAITSPGGTSSSGAATDQAAQAAAEKKEPEVDVSAFALLSKKEAKLRESQRAFKEREAAIAKREAELAEDAKLKEQDPYAWAEKHGVRYGDWTKKLLRGGADTQQAPSAELKRVEEKIDRIEREKQEAAARAEQAAIDAEQKKITSQVDKLLSDDRFYRVADIAEAFPETVDVHSAVLNVMATSWKAGVVLEPEEALEVLNELLAERENKLFGGRMAKRRSAQPAAQASTAQAGKKRDDAKAGEGRQAPKTVTNAAASTAADDSQAPSDDWEARKAYFHKKYFG